MTTDKKNIRTFEQIDQEFSNPVGRTIVIAHRGIWLHAPENSLPAIKETIAQGVDIVEIDVRRTSDGQLVLMHDETVDRMTNGQGKVADLTLTEIRSLQLKDRQGGADEVLTEEGVPTLEEAMLAARNKIFVNLDKCWDYREDVYEVLNRTGTVKQAIFKSNADIAEVASFLESKPVRPEYMQVIDESNVYMLNQLTELLARISPKAVELIFSEETSLIASEDTIGKLKGKCRIWLNTMWGYLCGGHADDSVFEYPEQGWVWALDKGFNMIQTDCAAQLLNYLRANPKRMTDGMNG